MTTVLVTGGTGVLGSALVPRLKDAGYTVRITSRRPASANTDLEVEWAQVDMATGSGVAPAVSDVDVIVHAASDVSKAEEIDVRGTERLLERAREAGVSHVIYISIVGVDKIPFGYYQHKLAAERLIEISDVPWSILRATQFHTFIDTLLQPLKWLPIAPLPTDFQAQPIDPDDVAERLCECIEEGPAGRLPDIGGPAVHRLGDLAQTWLSARRLRRWVFRLPLPGQVAAGFRQGHNTVPENKYGAITWDEWLRQKYRRA